MDIQIEGLEKLARIFESDDPMREMCISIIEDIESALTVLTITGFAIPHLRNEVKLAIQAEFREVLGLEDGPGAVEFTCYTMHELVTRGSQVANSFGREHAPQILQEHMKKREKSND